MIGADGLKCAPESMADMDGNNDHGGNINGYVDRVLKSGGYNLKNGGVGFIDKMKV